MEKIKVVAAYIEKNGEILLAQRSGGKYDNMWEFPGGKLENDEEWEDALVRELKEELNVNVEAGEFVASTQHQYLDQLFDIRLYRARYIDGDFVLRVHKCIAWVDKRVLSEEYFELPPADVELVKKLRNSEYYLR
jgi:8-oxo-dGTP diphosphatase